MDGKNPNRQLIGGKHPIIYRLSTIPVLYVVDFPLGKCQKPSTQRFQKNIFGCKSHQYPIISPLYYHKTAGSSHETTKKTHEIPLFFPLQAFPALTHCILPAAVVPWMIVGKHVRTGSVLSWREAVKTLRAFGCFWGPSGERHSFFCGHEKWFGFSRSVHQLLPEIEGLHQDLMFFWYWIFIDQSLGRKVIPI